MIEVKNIYKTYKLGETEVRALRGVDLKIKEGEFTFIVGPSGSGKTTLLDIIGTIARPTKGQVFIDGKNVEEFNDFQLSMFRRKKIGFVFQTFNLLPTLTALENVLVPLMPDKITPERRKKGIKLLEEMGLGERLHHIPTKLSGGERQRVTVARALINDPVMVLADEPTGELDSKTGDVLLDHMRKMNKDRGTTFLLVTHNEDHIKKGDRYCIIKDGKIVSDRKKK